MATVTLITPPLPKIYTALPVFECPHRKQDIHTAPRPSGLCPTCDAEKPQVLHQVAARRRNGHSYATRKGGQWRHGKQRRQAA